MKILVKPRIKQMTRYTDNEMYSLFVEGKIRNPLPKVNKKKYKRKEKYKNV